MLESPSTLVFTLVMFLIEKAIFSSLNVIVDDDDSNLNEVND